MGYAIAIGPTGRLRLILDDDESAAQVPAAPLASLRESLVESNAAGLLALTSADWPAELPSTFAFWRNWVRLFFRHVCHSEGEPGASWRSLEEPSDAECTTIVDSAPPMVGLEFVSKALLQTSWRELCEHVAERSMQEPRGPIAWLQSINPLAHLVGKVTFHLAENKRDPERPFAFLATFAHRLSVRSKPQHRPLADALRQSIAENDREQLERLLEPVRRAAEQSPLVDELLKTKRLFAPQAWTAAQAYRFLQDTAAMENAGVVVRVPNWWSPRKPIRPQVQVRIGTKEPSSVGADRLLDFKAEIALDGEPLSAEEMKRLLSETPGLTLLRGKWVEVDQAKLKQVLDHWRDVAREHVDGLGMIEAMRMLAGAQIESDDESVRSVERWSTLAAGDWLRTTLEKMRHPQQAAGCKPGRDLQATLRPYQVEGVNWLWFMTELGLGACLADDMGLGKTIQILDLLLQRKRAAGKEPRAPSLLIVPASLLGNWKQEASRFAPSLKVCLVHGSEIEAEEAARRTKDPSVGFAEFDLVVTSYGMVRRQPWLEKMKWSLIVLDEAQAIKNANAAQTRAVKKLQGERRIVMTGTPIENHVGELWSLFDFSSPGLLGNSAQFKRYVSNLNRRTEEDAFAGLRKLVRPYILRRQKSDPEIACDLPEKIEMRAECGLTTAQTVLYAKAVESLAKELKESEGIQRRGIVLSTLMQLKQICNHPDQYLRESAFAPDKSGKFQRLRLLCEPIAARQEKMLVFTQFQSMCEPLADFLASVFGRAGLVLHGATPVKKRAELVKEFQRDAERPFFVISLKAGGSGLNLTAASHVVHFDRWWNPAVENQATDRAFRIGQTRNVLVHKFMCRGTVEERIDAMITEKRAVAEQILDGEGPSNITEMSDEALLKFVSLDLGRASSDADEGSPAAQSERSPVRRVKRKE